MERIEQIAEAALQGDGLMTRSLVQDFFRSHPRIAEVSKPATEDKRLLAAAASLLELFALRLKQEAPSWTRSIGPLTEPIFLLKSAASMPRLRALCEAESPEPLRKRGFYAPPNYLELV
ncbi:hypothetical protein L0337_00660 [candidate division KSB1 bacterium]|nr:hypothetical protein [candidate division KSB1 bacterium]